MTESGGETPPQPEKTVTLGTRNPLTLVLRACPLTGTVGVYAPTEPRSYVGRVTGLASSQPRCELEGRHRSMSEYRRAALRSAALEFHYSQVGAPSLIRPVEQPPPEPPGRGSKRVEIAGATIAFTPDFGRRSVSLHTGLGSPRLIGEVTGIDDGAETKLFLAAEWIAVFASPEDCEEAKTVARDVLRAERDALRRRRRA